MQLRKLKLLSAFPVLAMGAPGLIFSGAHQQRAGRDFCRFRIASVNSMVASTGHRQGVRMASRSLPFEDLLPSKQVSLQRAHEA